MSSDTPLPPAGVAVGVLSIVFGAHSLYEVMEGLTRNHINLDFGVILLPAGVGILFRRNIWRFIARIVYGLTILFAPLFILFAVLMAANSGAEFTYTAPTFLEPLIGGAIALVIMLAIAMFALNIWCYHILGRDDVRKACDNFT